LGPNSSFLGAAFGLGFIIGPALGGILANPNIVSWFTESTPFLAAMILSLLSALLLHLTIPETFVKTSKKIGKINPFQGIENIKAAFKIKELATILAVLFFIYLGFTFFTQFSGVYLKDKMDFDIEQLSKFFAFIGLVLFLTQMALIRFLTKYFKPKQIVAVVLLILSAGLIIFLIPETERSLYIIAPIIPIAFGLLQPNMLSIISNSASNQVQGKILGIQQSIRSLGFTIPPLASIYVSRLDINYPNILGAFLIFIAWLIFILSYKKIGNK